MMRAGCVWRSYLDCGGLPTEVLAICANGIPALQVLVVPGNPGTAAYYRPLLCQLYQALKGQADVLAVSQVGHDHGPHNAAGKLWNLDDQIEHKVALLREHLCLTGRPPVVVVAHSIGSYISLHALWRYEQRLGFSLTKPAATELLHKTSTIGQRPLDSHILNITAKADVSTCQPLQPGHAPDAQVAGLESKLCSQQPEASPKGHAPPSRESTTVQDAVLASLPWPTRGKGMPASCGSPEARPRIVKFFALMPFFEADTAHSWRQRWLRALAAHYRLLGRVASVLASLPNWIKDIVIRFFASAMDEEAVRTTRQLLHPHAVANNFYLGHHEFRELAQPFDWRMLGQLGPRLHVLGCPQDIWFSEVHYKIMRTHVPAIQATWIPTLRHAFVVDGSQIAVVTAYVEGHVRQAGLLPDTQDQQRQEHDKPRAPLASPMPMLMAAQAKL